MGDKGKCSQERKKKGGRHRKANIQKAGFHHSVSGSRYNAGAIATAEKTNTRIVVSLEQPSRVVLRVPA
jgi:hypothetical protein